MGAHEPRPHCQIPLLVNLPFRGVTQRVTCRGVQRGHRLKMQACRFWLPLQQREPRALCLVGGRGCSPHCAPKRPTRSSGCGGEGRRAPAIAGARPPRRVRAAASCSGRLLRWMLQRGGWQLGKGLPCWRAVDAGVCRGRRGRRQGVAAGRCRRGAAPLGGHKRAVRREERVRGCLGERRGAQRRGTGPGVIVCCRGGVAPPSAGRRCDLVAASVPDSSSSSSSIYLKNSSRAGGRRPQRRSLDARRAPAPRAARPGCASAWPLRGLRLAPAGHRRYSVCSPGARAAPQAV
jgi:hypothetical protein